QAVERARLDDPDHGTEEVAAQQAVVMNRNAAAVAVAVGVDGLARGLSLGDVIRDGDRDLDAGRGLAVRGPPEDQAGAVAVAVIGRADVLDPTGLLLAVEPAERGVAAWAQVELDLVGKPVHTGHG